MKILVSWLRELVDVPVAPPKLASDLHMAGFEVASVEPPPGTSGVDEDAIIDLEITANRPDCLSVVGIAREVATLYDTAHHVPAVATLGPADPAVVGELRVTIEDAVRCPRYCAALAEVRVGSSPDWMERRLAAAGVRPINNIVDITNYVLLELGHPMHAFDLARLGGRELRIRAAWAGERITTLDGQERALAPDMLVIADQVRPQAIGGVMGGGDSEVSATTQVIALESAWFEPTGIRRTSRRLGLSTEASYRFERGADIEAPPLALARACALLEQTGAGRALPGWVDAYPAPRDRRQVCLELPRVAQVLGVEVPTPEITRTLVGLGFDVQARAADPQPPTHVGQGFSPTDDETSGISPADDETPAHAGASAEHEVPAAHQYVGQGFSPAEGETSGFSPAEGKTAGFSPADTLDVVVPSWRVDVARDIDLIEEIARHFGYDRLPSTFPRLDTTPAAPDQRLERDRLVRRFASAAGFAEAVTFSFIEHQSALSFAPEPDLVEVLNPLSEQFAVLRPSLLPGLVDAVAHNRRREQEDARLFEVGTVFGADSGERRALGLAWIGGGAPGHWSGSGRPVDFFDMKGVVELVASGLGVTVALEAADRPFLVRGRSAAIVSSGPDGRAIGVIGQLVPALASARDIPAQAEVYVAEIDLDAASELTAAPATFTSVPPPRHPAVVRDISIVVNDTLPAAIVRGTIHAAAPATLTRAREFDRYQGPGVPEGRVSLSYRLTFQAADRTLTDTEVQRAMSDIVQMLVKEHGAVQR